MRGPKRRWLLLAPLAAATFAMVAEPHAAADNPDPAEATERCATRLSVAILGKSPSAALLGGSGPQAQVDAMLEDPAFVERFSSFLNGRFNSQPGTAPDKDSAYFLTRYVLDKKLPYKEIFVGKYDVRGSNGTVKVTVDPDGLGYFRSDPWLRRYAGNEQDGYKISTAYRIMNNTVGLKLVATTDSPGTDISETGRQANACRGCHADGWFALDKVSKVLSRRRGTGNSMSFDSPTDGPQKILDGATISNDKELVTALVDSQQFKFNACRLAFSFLYGRPETTCEAPAFDRCMTDFTATGTMQSALAAIAKDPGFCE